MPLIPKKTTKALAQLLTSPLSTYQLQQRAVGSRNANFLATKLLDHRGRPVLLLVDLLRYLHQIYAVSPIKMIRFTKKAGKSKPNPSYRSPHLVLYNAMRVGQVLGDTRNHTRLKLARRINLSATSMVNFTKKILLRASGSGSGLPMKLIFRQ